MSLCQICARKIGTCSWERDFTPVPGWTAEPTRLRMSTQDKDGNHIPREIDSFRVLECPLYVPPDMTYRPITVNTSGVPIMATNRKTGEVAFYPSISAACAFGGFHPSAIHKCLIGEQKDHNGHTFDKVVAE